MTVPNHQGRADKIAFRVTFPVPLEAKHVSLVMHCIANRPHGAPAIALEVWATEGEFMFRLCIPRNEAEFIVPQFRALMPGCNVTPEHRAPAHDWTDIVALNDAAPGCSFYIPNQESMATTILASMQPRAGEVLLWQLVVAPPSQPYVVPKDQKPPRTKSTIVNALLAKTATPKEETVDKVAKLAVPNANINVRVAACAATRQRAEQLIANVEAALGTMRGKNKFKRVTHKPDERLSLLERVATATASPSSAIQASAGELSALSAWPVGTPAVAGLPQSRARHLATSPAVARTGIVVADSNVPGQERPVALTKAGMTMHTVVMGSTGAGKTVVEANIFAQFIADGGGAMVIESKGDGDDLYHRALNYIPKGRIKDVVLLDIPGDRDRPTAFNVLQQGHPQVVAGGLETLFAEVYGSYGVRMPAAVFHGVMVACTTKHARQPMTLADLPILYAPRSEEERDLANHLIRGTPDEEIRRWWELVNEQYPRPNQRRTFFEPINQRLWQIIGRRELRNVVAQPESSFNLYRTVAENKIILVNLAGFGRQTRDMFGSLLVDLFWNVIKGRAATRPYLLCLDEAQNYPAFALDIGTDMLSEGRAFNLCCVLATQGVNRLTPKVADTVMNNCLNKIIFQADSANARAFVREFGRSVIDNDIVSLSKYEALGRIVGDSGVSPPMTMLMRPPLPSAGLAHQVRLHSRQSYGREVAHVEAEIRARRGGRDDQPPARPPVGESDW